MNPDEMSLWFAIPAIAAAWASWIACVASERKRTPPTQ